MSARKIYVIHATWDDEARVWVATSKDILGLATEAKSCDAMIAKLKIIVPELLEANGITANEYDEVPIEVVSKVSMMAKLRAIA